MSASKALTTAESDREAVESTLKFLEDEWSDHFHTPLDAVGAEQNMDIAKNAKEELIKAHTRIVHCKPADLDDHIKTYCLMMKRFVRLLTQFQGVRDKAIPTSSGSSSGPASNPSSKVKLPTLSLPTFDGTLTDWVQFRDMFMSAVDKNTSLSDAQKLAHLKSVLVGEPSLLIKTLLLTDANYCIAWNTLKSRYDNEKELTFAIYRRFLAQQQVTSHSSKSLRCLLDVSNECVQSLNAQNVQVVDGLESFMVYILLTKLDQSSRELFEQSLKDLKVPSLKSLQDFMEQRARSLTAGEGLIKTVSLPKDTRRISHTHHTSDAKRCAMDCSDPHPLFKCKRFHSKSASDRYEVVKKNRLCFNCLSVGHSIGSCSSSSRCKGCSGRHHSLICLRQQDQLQQQEQVMIQPSASAVVNHTNQDGFSQTMLATAVVRVVDGNGQGQLCRAMLDGGSTTSFITQACVQRLSLQQERSNVSVIGLSSTHVGSANCSTTVTFASHFESSSSFVITALVLPKITGHLPYYRCNSAALGHLHGLRLADPQFNVSSSIDLLLGSDVFWNLLLDGKIGGPVGTPVGINSHLGWLVAGNTSNTIPRTIVQTFHQTTELSLDLQLQRFWELETVPTSSLLTPDELKAEKHFLETHSRDADGRFLVHLPKKVDISNLGESRATAIRRLKSLECRLQRNPSHHTDYHKFMKEYIELGHMELVPMEEVMAPRHPTYYIPHHFVLKEESTTTKFRVVCDASSKTSSGMSLNDCLLVGPVIQDNLADIVTRIRCHEIAFTADIAKMYRQIRIPPADADLQRILWREHPSLPIQEYRIKTVAYGTAPAPFLATRCLQEIAHSAAEEFPLESKIILHDFFMDDLASGADTDEEAIERTKNLRKLVERGQMFLRKWASNSRVLLQSIPPELRESGALPPSPTTTPEVEVLRTPEEDPPLFGGSDFSVKLLGIRWNTTADYYHYQFKLPSTDDQVPDTKRSISSDSAKLFDPLGWISPVIITAKILLQSLWKLECSWDSAVPSHIQQQWNSFKTDLQQITKIQVPRCIMRRNYYRLDLAGFSDASEKAYSAVVYLIAYYHNSPPLISLVNSKTRVAPAKLISLPRLELCGALLLSQLTTHVKFVLRRDITRVRAWTDSTIVLSWIRTPSCRLKTFVANRVTEIQAHIPPSSWNHIAGVNNPADCASRGISPQELSSHPLWWKGPSFLQDPPTEEDEDARINLSEDDNKVVESELRPTVVTLTCVSSTPPLLDVLLRKFPSVNRLVRVVAWCRRFIGLKCSPKSSATGALQREELDKSLLTIIKFVQLNSFPEELMCFTKGQQLASKSTLLALNPFVDDAGVLRVGGRLRHSQMSHNRKHPILLPRHSLFTDLLIRSKHTELFHAGPNLVQSVLQQSFWILRAKDAIRFQIRKCVECRRQAAVTFQAKMGDLPSPRVTPGRAFLNCGVDYAGPFSIKSGVPRSKIQLKAYLCLFICMATRAVHLELVTSLSTEAFFAALKRFVARRNKPAVIYSDCGTNFVGAARELKQLLTVVKSSSHNNAMADKVAALGISWRFNPPSAPHFGGLWEAGVKSVKFHLKRVVGAAALTYEELSTLLTQVESCLNSRPLTPMSSSPNDLCALTPGHFLTGDSLQAVPEADLMDIRTGRLNRWQLIQQMHQQFWHRWSTEYVARLQQRPKWLNHRTSIQLEDLVIIKDERFPPQKWKLGRVQQLHPGPDGVTRVVTLKTADGVLQRPIVKLCLLPIENTSPSESDSL